jgi:ArsR family transcriptional regulator, arsenate/arsenite/antimonite-responsive transcriptional repressor
MDVKHALTAFSALSHDTRLQVFRLLIRAGAAGMLAGEISRMLAVRQNTLSANLSILLHAGLVRNRREGREIRYFANLEGLRDLLRFLMEDCCGGNPALCRPILDEIAGA